MNKKKKDKKKQEKQTDSIFRETDFPQKKKFKG
jgi:hypothetical protein